MFTTDTYYQAVRKSAERITHACGHFHATTKEAEKCITRPRNEVVACRTTYTRPYEKVSRETQAA